MSSSTWKTAGRPSAAAVNRCFGNVGSLSVEGFAIGIFLSVCFFMGLWWFYGVFQGFMVVLGCILGCCSRVWGGFRVCFLQALVGFCKALGLVFLGISRWFIGLGPVSG